MNHLPQAWGRPRDDVYGAYDHSYFQTSGPKQSTQQPIVTGTSVIAIKFKDGVVIATDNLASYGSLARFTDVKRLRQFNKSTILGFGGDVSDMQYLDRLLLSLAIRENYSSYSSASDDTDDTSNLESLNAKNLHTYMSKVMYRRRSDFNPLWNQILVAGFGNDEKPFLASVDLLGTTFSSPSLATGFGAHLAQPIMRKVVPDEASVANLDKETAVQTIRDCMKVLFYRDARSMDKYSIAVVTKDGIDLKEDEKLENQSWAFADRIKGYGTQVV
ncbi:proteasome endopeptidase complex, beta subunit [Rhizodiscina lignyota]|uniref:Proteasome subunit beta n=1 Tax=Rhizodiscina lignyota TaxID=1504668 RepID=A0A9P4M6A1_9PEZI|nr:proteasome endopeptidase complex, beta subunit [Rhizodiscina lignyota]